MNESDIAVVAAVASVLGAVATAFVNLWQTKRAFRLEWTKRILDWGDSVIDELSHAQEIATRSEMRPSVDLDGALGRLSGLIDRGRIFFKNIETKRRGVDKPSAYRGLRPKLLDYMVDVYVALDQLRSGEIKPGVELRDRIVADKRYFVSQLTKEISVNWVHHAAGYGNAERGDGSGAPVRTLSDH